MIIILTIFDFMNMKMPLWRATAHCQKSTPSYTVLRLDSQNYGLFYTECIFSNMMTGFITSTQTIPITSSNIIDEPFCAPTHTNFTASAEVIKSVSHRGCGTSVSDHNITSTLNILFKRRIFMLSFKWAGNTSIGHIGWLT
jgi:hypothetical protein